MRTSKQTKSSPASAKGKRDKSVEPALRQLAVERFGYKDLRPGQEEAIQSVLSGRDTLAVMPTGLGKSAIYQIAGLLISGPTVVVSPLIALQRDQVESINDKLVAPAAAVNSTELQSQRQETLENFESGDLEFLFLSPEQLSNDEILAQLSDNPPSLFVVDEAHCISDWGHDFRPDYLKLGAVIEALGHPTVLALTATAAPPVRDEIVQRLGLRDPRVLVQDFDRPNIWLGVEQFFDEQDKLKALLERSIGSVSRGDSPGIVYSATRQGAEDVAAALVEQQIRAAHYHAGMKKTDRQRVQEEFMSGALDVIVATVAFGMGIDKADVRFVFHHTISESLDSYYQELGRAGRDGEYSQAVLFYNAQDLNLRRFQATGARITEDEVELAIGKLATSPECATAEELGEIAELSSAKAHAILERLHEVGFLKRDDDGSATAADAKLSVADAAEAAVELQEQRRQFDRSRVEMMQGYAETETCLREYLLSYFGESTDGPCDNCSNCRAGLQSTPDAAIARDTQQKSQHPFPEQSRVVHAEWGEGQVLRYEDDKIFILFDDIGYKTLSVELVQEGELLHQLQ